MRPSYRSRRGVVLVLYGLAMMVMLLCLALALDVGYLYTQKSRGQLTEDITALVVLGSLDRTLSSANQFTYCDEQVNNMEKANGLPVGFWEIVQKITRTDGDVVKLVLNRTNPLDTMMMNLIGIAKVNVGLESIAVRGFVRDQVNPECPGNLGLFGCTRLRVQGNPMVDSYKSSAGSYASQAVNPGCGASGGGHGGHLSHGGHGGHGEGLYARRNVLGGSNRLVTMGGSFCYHGNTQSGLDTELIGGGGYLDGNVKSETFSGDQDLVSGTVSLTNVSEINLTPAVGSASAASNDNSLIAGAKASELASPNFRLTPASGSSQIVFPAGKKFYLKEINIPGSASILISGDPLVTGPVELTIDGGPVKINGDITSTSQPTRPGWLKIWGIGGCSECCVGCISSGHGHRGGHGHHDDSGDGGDDDGHDDSGDDDDDHGHDDSGHGSGEPSGHNCTGYDSAKDHSMKFAGNSSVYADIYAPGYGITLTGVDSFYGRIIAEDINIQGAAKLHYDEDLGGCIQTVSDDTAADGEKVHLIN